MVLRYRTPHEDSRATLAHILLLSERRSPILSFGIAVCSASPRKAQDQESPRRNVREHSIVI